MVMEEFQKVYTVASIYRGIFAKAIQQFYASEAVSMGIAGSPVFVSAGAAQATEGPATAASVPVGVASVPMAVDAGAGAGAGAGNDVLETTEMTSDLIDALVDEASTFNFWETWGQLWVDQ